MNSRVEVVLMLLMLMLFWMEGMNVKAWIPLNVFHPDKFQGCAEHHRVARLPFGVGTVLEQDHDGVLKIVVHNACIVDGIPYKGVLKIVLHNCCIDAIVS